MAERDFIDQNTILLFDYNNLESQDLLASFRNAGRTIRAFVINDDGYLTDGMESVYGLFLGDYKNSSNATGIPRFFNQIRVPDYWEITATSQSAEISDKGNVKGRIYYAEPKNKRFIKHVDWYDSKNVVRYTDHYNCYGALWARTVYNLSGQKVNKSYFNADGAEIIVENYVVGDIILHDGKTDRIFPNKTQFVKYCLEKNGFSKGRVFFNSLSTPFFVSEAMEDNGKNDILFWQENARPDVPGNMTIILNNTAARCGKIYVQKERSYNKLIEAGANPAVLGRLGFVYSFTRDNMHRAEALICTNSDNIEKLEELTEGLKGIHFHIAAITEMSSKLMAFGEKSNVSLYPGADTETFAELFEKCDLYFDVNHENEIVSALRRAFLNKQLIFGFKETLHNNDYISEKNVYNAENFDKMIADIERCIDDARVFDKLLAMQMNNALTESAVMYENI